MSRLTGNALLILVGCASAAPPAPTTAPSSADEQPTAAAPVATLDCGPQVRGAEPVLAPGSVTLVGEMHGTEQVPALVGRLACQATGGAGRTGVVVGLELPRENQAAVDTYLASDGGEAARADLLACPHFSSEWHDGRDSEAMVALLESIRAWRASGAAIHVVAYDADPGTYESGRQRDEKMAQRLTAARAERRDATFFVLSGNIHNRTTKGTPWDPEFVPMGKYLLDAAPGLRSLDFRSSGGTLWVCMKKPDSDEQQCGKARTGGKDQGDEPFIELWDEPNELGFHGVYYVGPTTASPPAKPATAG